RALLTKNYCDIVKPRSRAFVDQLGASQRRAASALDRLREAKIDRVVLRIFAVQHYIKESTLTRGEYFRDASDGRRQRAVRGDDPHAARPLRYQHAPFGQEGDRPRMLQSLRNGLDDDLAG